MLDHIIDFIHYGLQHKPKTNNNNTNKLLFWKKAGMQLKCDAFPQSEYDKTDSTKVYIEKENPF